MSVRKQLERIREFAAKRDFPNVRALGAATLKKYPGNLTVGLVFAEALLAAGDAAGAAKVLSTFPTTRKAPIEYFLMYAFALMQSQRLEDCLDVVIAGLARHANHPELLNSAGLLNDWLKRPTNAEQFFRRLTEVQPRRGSAFLGLGNALRQLGRSHEALEAYGSAVALEPNDPSAQVNRANMLSETGDFEAAHAAYRKILARFPQRKEVLSNMAASLAISGKHAAAAEAYEAYLETHPNDYDAHLYWGKALLKSGNAAASESVLEAMAQTYPDRSEICPELINACLKNGGKARARHYQELYRKRFPTSAHVYSCDTILDAASGGEDAARNEALYEADIEVSEIARPEEYADDKAFWDDVCTAVYAHPSLRESPREHATREGFHSDNLAEEPVAPPIRQLIAAVERHARDYAAKRANAGNPFYDGLILDGNVFRMWAVVMREGGHQEAHIHPSARISGVVYAKVPPSIRDGNDRSGWIEFGRPHSDFFEPETLVTRLYQPKLGRIVLFPSYLYHKTMPLEGSSHRISIAFDFCTP
jgi:Flp pilus assembly protein TadD